MFTLTETDRLSRVSESGLALCRVPSADDVGASRLWSPIPHRKLWAALVQNLAANGFPLVDSPEIFVSPNGRQVVGGLHVRGGDEYRVVLPSGREILGRVSRAIVFNNSNGRDGSLGLAHGASVWVCANGCISGSHVVRRKHITSTDWYSAVETFCRDLPTRFRAQAQKIQTMVDTPHTDDTAAHDLIRRRMRDRLPAHVMDRAWRLWKNPPHQEFEGRNAWSLYNAVTEAAKKSSIRSQRTALRM